MKIRKIDFMELLFLLLVLTGEHFFYLVNLPITEMDLAVIIAVVMFFVYLLYYKGVGLPHTDKQTKDQKGGSYVQLFPCKNPSG